MLFGLFVVNHIIQIGFGQLALSYKVSFRHHASLEDVDRTAVYSGERVWSTKYSRASLSSISRAQNLQIWAWNHNFQVRWRSPTSCYHGANAARSFWAIFSLYISIFCWRLAGVMFRGELGKGIVWLLWSSSTSSYCINTLIPATFHNW